MTVHTQDPDMLLLHGDVLEQLATLEPDSVDCVITSPPYWGLRDYGTGTWAGGNPDCDHLDPDWQSRVTNSPKQQTSLGSYDRQEIQACRKCGATRTDQQLGLEPTPDLYVQRMVELFRQVRRVLAKHGTCWVNLGDSYAGSLALTTNEKALKGKQGTSRGTHGTLEPRPLAPGLKPKDLVMIPARLALALQADGWWLRADIIWAKPNPMPESVTDRPTKAHEYVFLLTKQPRYWFDQEAVREPHNDKAGGVERFGKVGRNGGYQGTEQPDALTRTTFALKAGAREYNPAGRNVRSVWELATQPYPDAHFATFPEELVRRCLLAGCPQWVCRVCGRPRERIVDVDETLVASRRGTDAYKSGGVAKGATWAGTTPGVSKVARTVDWSDCGHNDYRPGLVLDPFVGSGTVPLVARKHGRHSIGIDLNAAYLDMAARRTHQLALEVTA